jgi:hypothetical protein
MDAEHFDTLARRLHTRTRRRVLGLLSGMGVVTVAATLGLDLPREAAAKCKKKCPPCKHCKNGRCKRNPEGSPGTKCPDPGNECVTPICSGGVCGTSPVVSGTAIANQTSGDCQKVVCDGAGGTRSEDDNSDVPPDDGKECTFELCEFGVPRHANLPNGFDCSGGKHCDGNGNCV